MDELEELQRRCGAYAFFAGKQSGGIMALRHAMELNIMTYDDVKNRLSELIDEFTQESEKVFYKKLSESDVFSS